jgi:RNA polymerase sigma factor (TIGR02999 family)
MMSDVTLILSNLAEGDPSAAEQLLPLVYDELRKLAAAKMAAERPGQTLDATALVHEAYVRLVADEKRKQGTSWSGRRHFFAAAAEAMRRILVESARRKKTAKHGGQVRRQPLADQAELRQNDDILALDAALTTLADHDAIAARVVELRYFAGLGHDEIALTLDITVYRARQKWTYARAWLRRELSQ